MPRFPSMWRRNGARPSLVVASRTAYGVDVACAAALHFDGRPVLDRAGGRVVLESPPGSIRGLLCRQSLRLIIGPPPNQSVIKRRGRLERLGPLPWARRG